MNIVDVLNEKYPLMTKKQHAVTDFMLANPESMSFITLKELANQTGVSEMTILNLCTTLGCKNYNDLKYEFRKYVSVQMKIEVQKQNLYASGDVPNYELNDKRKTLMEICSEELEQAKLLYASLDIDKLFTAAEMFLEANHTIFCGRGVSVQIAEFLSMRLATMGLPSIVVDTERIDNIHAALPFFSKNVLVVPISLPDYYLMTTKVCEFAKMRRTSILCLTDSDKSPIAHMGDLVLMAPCSTRIYLNTISPMIALANLLTSALNIERSRRKNNRFTSHEEFTRFFAE